MRRFAPVLVITVTALAVWFTPGCTQSCDAYAIVSEVFVELPPGWEVSQLCVDSVCVPSQTVEISGDPGIRPYNLDVIGPDGALRVLDGDLATYAVPAGRSCGGPGLQGRISIQSDGSVTTS